MPISPLICDIDLEPDAKLKPERLALRARFLDLLSVYETSDVAAVQLAIGEADKSPLVVNVDHPPDIAPYHIEGSSVIDHARAKFRHGLSSIAVNVTTIASPPSMTNPVNHYGELKTKTAPAGAVLVIIASEPWRPSAGVRETPRR